MRKLCEINGTESIQKVQDPHMELQEFLRRVGSIHSSYWVALLPEQRKQQCQDDADDDRGSERKIESKILSSNDNISGKPADPWYLFSDQQKQTGDNDQNAQKDEHFP
jgi:hypothetical protein